MGTNILVDEGFRDVGRKVVTYRDRPDLSFYELAKKKGKRQFGYVNVGVPATDQAALKTAMMKKRQGEVNKVILHHDGMATSAGCFGVLRDRGLSTHFMIDRDGTIYQPLNVREVAYHSAGLNVQSIGIDICNPIRANRIRRSARAFEQSKGYARVFSGRINGAVRKSIGYTDAQYESLIALLAQLKDVFSLLTNSMDAPVGTDGRILRTRLADVAAFTGIVGHQHVSATKWDPGPGFDWERVLIGLKGQQLYYPITLPETKNLVSVAKRKALDNAESYFLHNEQQAKGGFFPFGANQAWHSGIHLPMKLGTPVMAPADGTVVLAKNTAPDERLGSPNVVVIKHETVVDEATKTYYSVLSHLRQEKLGKKSPIEWIRAFAKKGGQDDWGDDEVSEFPPARPGHRALVDGRVALVEGVEVKAGDVIGHVGPFNSGDVIRSGGLKLTDKAKKLGGVLDFAAFSFDPVFGVDDPTFLRVDDDDDPGALCNSRAVWKTFTTNPETLRGLVEGGYPLSIEEIKSFFQTNDAKTLRWMSTRHVTEWSKETDFSGLFGGGVDFEWSTRKAAKIYMKRIQKFLWWDDEVTKFLGAPKERLVWTYNPIAFFTILAMGEARRIVKAGDFKELDAEELRAFRERDGKLEAGSEGEGSYASRATEVRYSDLEAEENIDDDGDVDYEKESWMRWDQGEWDP